MRIDSANIEKHEELNPKIWDKNKSLRPEIKEVVLNVVEEFKKSLKEDDIPLKIKDVILLGSNASYDYTKNSDIDIHIIADTSILKCPADLLPVVYRAYRDLFNKKYQVTANGMEIELFVESDKSDAYSNGVYSVYKNEWLKKPNPNEVPEVEKDKEDEFDEKFDKLEEEYENLINNNPKAEDVEKFIDNLFTLRKNGIMKEGIYGIGNQIFKEFRNLGYMDNLKELRNALKSKEMSGGKNNENISKVKN